MNITVHFFNILATFGILYAAIPPVTPNTTVLPVNKAYLLHFMSTFPIAVVSTAATIASGTPFVAMIVKITP